MLGHACERQPVIALAGVRARGLLEGLERLGPAAEVEQGRAFEPQARGIAGIDGEGSIGELEGPGSLALPGRELADAAARTQGTRVGSQNAIVLGQRIDVLALLLGQPRLGVMAECLGARVGG